MVYHVLQNSSNEVLVRSFQLAFTLRDISLNERGQILNLLFYFQSHMSRWTRFEFSILPVDKHVLHVLVTACTCCITWGESSKKLQQCHW